MSFLTIFQLQLIHYVYSLLFSKIDSRTNNFGIQKKNNFDFYFATWKNRKTNTNIGAKILKQPPQSIANQVTCEVLSNVKDPMNYQDRAVHKNEQKPIDFKKENGERPININENVQKKKKS